MSFFHCPRCGGIPGMTACCSTTPEPSAAVRRNDEAQELRTVLQAVQEQLNRFGDRLPDGFDSRVMRWVDDALASNPEQAPTNTDPSPDQNAGVTLEGALDTLFHIAEYLGIDYKQARSAPGKPSDVYITAINRRYTDSVMLKSILATARQAGWSFRQRFDGVTEMVPLVHGVAQTGGSLLATMSNPDVLRLQLGELNAQELRAAQAAVRLTIVKARESSANEIDMLKTVCAESYQVVGVLADDCGRFDDNQVQKALDNLNQQRMVHADVLPFPSIKDSRAPESDAT